MRYNPQKKAGVQCCIAEILGGLLSCQGNHHELGNHRVEHYPLCRETRYYKTRWKPVDPIVFPLS